VAHHFKVARDCIAVLLYHHLISGLNYADIVFDTNLARHFQTFGKRRAEQSLARQKRDFFAQRGVDCIEHIGHVYGLKLKSRQGLSISGIGDIGVDAAEYFINPSLGSGCVWLIPSSLAFGFAEHCLSVFSIHVDGQQPLLKIRQLALRLL
jgi:hypothetical protein